MDKRPLGSSIPAEVRGEDHDTFVVLDCLQQVSDFDVRVAVVRIPSPRTACRRSRPLRRRRTARCPRAGERAVEVLLRLADVFAEETGQIDLDQIEADLARDNADGHGLAGAGRVREEHLSSGGSAVLPFGPSGRRFKSSRSDKHLGAAAGSPWRHRILSSSG